MQRQITRRAARRDWRSLTATEKQHLLADLRRSQQRQLAHDARVLRLLGA